MWGWNAISVVVEFSWFQSSTICVSQGAGHLKTQTWDTKHEGVCVCVEVVLKAGWLVGASATF